MEKNRVLLQAEYIADKQDVILTGRLCYVAGQLFDIKRVLQRENIVLEEKQQYVNYKSVWKNEDVF